MPYIMIEPTDTNTSNVVGFESNDPTQWFSDRVYPLATEGFPIPREYLPKTMRQRRGPRMLRDFFMFQCNFWGSSARAREFLMKEAPGDFEFIPIEFIYKDGTPTQGGPYYYMNILNRAYTIDPEASDPSIEKTRKLVDGDGFPVKVVFWPGAFLKPAEAWHDRIVWPTFINGFFVSDRLGEALTSSRLSNVILEKIS